MADLQRIVKRAHALFEIDVGTDHDASKSATDDASISIKISPNTAFSSSSCSDDADWTETPVETNGEANVESSWNPNARFSPTPPATNRSQSSSPRRRGSFFDRLQLPPSKPTTPVAPWENISSGTGMVARSFPGSDSVSCPTSPHFPAPTSPLSPVPLSPSSPSNFLFPKHWRTTSQEEIPKRSPKMYHLPRSSASFPFPSPSVTPASVAATAGGEQPALPSFTCPLDRQCIGPWRMRAKQKRSPLYYHLKRYHKCQGAKLDDNAFTTKLHFGDQCGAKQRRGVVVKMNDTQFLLWILDRRKTDETDQFLFSVYYFDNYSGESIDVKLTVTNEDTEMERVWHGPARMLSQASSATPAAATAATPAAGLLVQYPADENLFYREEGKLTLTITTEVQIAAVLELNVPKKKTAQK